MAEVFWNPYEGKHFEAVWTRFYQGYILPQKYNVDKRKAHFSSLILSGFMSRKEALEQLKNPPYPIEQQMEDREYVIKKLGINNSEFDKIMQTPEVPHLFYESDLDRKLLIKLFHLFFSVYLRIIAYPLGIISRPVEI